jgi:hypothetical protein
MREMHRPKHMSWIAALAVIAGVAPRPAGAQAWLAPKGEASFSLAGQYLQARYHLLSEGERADRGRMQWTYAIADVGYSVSDRFALRIGIPYVVSRYTGAFPHLANGQTVSDDGTWNGTFQDVGVEARFMAGTGALAVTPFLGLGVPAASYPTHAHAAAGRHVPELTAGVNLGRRLDPLLPDAYAHAKLSFTMPERIRGIWHNRNNADFEVGYFVRGALGLRVLGAWQWTHGGFRIPIDALPGSENFLVHDQLAKDSHFIAGAGISYAVTGSVDLSVTGVRMISGENSNLTRGISLTSTWNFSPARLLRERKPVAPRIRPGVS